MNQFKFKAYVRGRDADFDVLRVYVGIYHPTDNYFSEPEDEASRIWECKTTHDVQQATNLYDSPEEAVADYRRTFEESAAEAIAAAKTAAESAKRES